MSRFIQLLRDACARHEPDACFRIGRAYAAGDLLPTNTDAAADYLQEACFGPVQTDRPGLRHLDACLALGQLCGRDADYCDRGQRLIATALACYPPRYPSTPLCHTQVSGNLVTRVCTDPTLEAQQRSRSCGQALYTAGLHLYAGAGVAPAPERAIGTWAQGCRLGHSDCCAAAREARNPEQRDRMLMARLRGETLEP
ncbi:MAG: sel1 repeat family protein [Deltaproteobacteria bacterium]|nr:sel1 repeat family protein [Deltaproteobacteria bacterium]